MTDLIVGVGLHKTGTTSLGVALDTLGYVVAGHRADLVPSLQRGALGPALTVARSVDAVQDTPWPMLFAELDDAVPGARFILTYRDPRAWIGSVLKHFGGTTTPMREWIYGAGYGDPQRSLDTYVGHLQHVRDYFHQRPQDLLELDMDAEPRWEELCAFLHHPVPAVPFPHQNKAQPRWTRRLKRAYGRLRV